MTPEQRRAMFANLHLTKKQMDSLMPSLMNDEPLMAKLRERKMKELNKIYEKNFKGKVSEMNGKSGFEIEAEKMGLVGEPSWLVQANDDPHHVELTKWGIDNRDKFRLNLLDIYNIESREISNARGQPDVDWIPSFKTDSNKITPPEGLQMKSPYNPKRNATTGLPERKSPRQSDWTRIIEAEKGFNGIVKKETTFKVAEHDKPEFVSVVPLENKSTKE